MDYKIIHTSDWHLGKKLFKSERLEEQRAFLEWLHKYIISESINLLIIAGDIYDVPSPPNSAQKMFYEFIFKLKDIKNFRSVIITGNHDSASLFGIPKDFFAENNCHICATLASDLSENELLIETKHGELGIKLLPYFRNFELLKHIDQDTDEKSLETFFRSFFSSWKSKPKYKFLVSHHGFGHFNASGSEHAIHLSGVEHFPLSWVKPYFDYVALGHIHKKQELSQEPPIIYCGSPLPLRFSESNNKFISQIVLNEKGLSYELIPIPITKKLIQLKTNFQNIESELAEVIKTNENCHGYLEVMISTDKPLSGIADLIRERLQDTNIELLSFIPKFTSTDKQALSLDKIQNTSLEELFEDYYKTKFENGKMPKELLTEFHSLLKEVRDEDS
jgi:exonuclease SbcD